MPKKFSSKDRMLAAISLEEPDVIPVAPYDGFWYAPKLLGLRISDYYLGSNKLRAKILLAAQKRHGYDWILAYTGHTHDWRKNVHIRDAGDKYIVTPKTTGWQLGGWYREEIVPKDDAPYYLPGYSNIEEIPELEINDSDSVLRGGELEQVKIISKRVGNELLVTNHLGVPYGDAAFMVGLKEWILALYTKPRLAEKAMEWCLSQTLEYAKALVDAGTEAFYMEEIWASTDIISPSLYERFAFPYERLQIEKLRKFGVPLIFSFCGNPMPILDKIIETKPDAHHFEESKKGFVVDIFKIREKLRGKTCFFMPFDAVNLLPSGNLKAIRESVIEIVTRTVEGGGVVLGTGCPLLKDTSPESLDMMIRTAREVGRYPIRA